MGKNKFEELNPVQAQIFRDVSKLVGAWLETGQPVMRAGEYRAIGYRAQLLYPVKVKILHTIAGLIKTGEWSLSDGIKLARIIFNKKYVWFWENQILAEIDVLAEEVVQAERRRAVDLSVLEKAMSAFTPDALEAERLVIRHEGVYWGRALQDIDSPHNPMNLSLVRQTQEDFDAIEVEIYYILSDIIDLNQRIIKLKAEAQDADDFKILDLAEEIKLLDQYRAEKRDRLKEKQAELKQPIFSWLFSARQALESSAREIIKCIGDLESRESKIDELLAQPSQEVGSVSEPDNLYILAEANINIAERLFTRADQEGLPRHKCKALTALANHFVEEARILEV